jgi:hypothetical protein
MAIDPPTGSTVELAEPATGVPDSVNGDVLEGLAPKLAVSVRGLPQIAGGPVTQGRPGVIPEPSWYHIGVSVPCWYTQDHERWMENVGAWPAKQTIW